MYKCGAKQSPIDLRDYKVKLTKTNLPDSFQLCYVPPVKNQGRVNSCVAHVMAEIMEYFYKVETGEFQKASTNFIYGGQGAFYGRTDEGMYFRDACKIAKNYGNLLYKDCPGNTEMPEVTKQVEKVLTKENMNYDNFKVKSYANCKNSIKESMYVHKSPILASLFWTDDATIEEGILCFNNGKSGSYHAIMIYGWNEQGYLCQNSWGTKWGNKGRFLLPYNEKIEEAWCFVDAKNTEIIKPGSTSKLVEVALKLLNKILNIIKKCPKCYFRTFFTKLTLSL